MALSKTFKCDADKLSRILEEVKTFGVQVQGDDKTGKLVGETMMGHFEGTYAYDGENLTLTITEKPAMIPESFLEGRLEEMVKKYSSE